MAMTLLACLLILANSNAVSDELFPEIAPSPQYAPNEVVGIQMRALGNNDSPQENAGIEITFRFASPSNRTVTGPLEKFQGLFLSPTYKPMLNHARLEVGPATLAGDTAMVPVLVIDSHGKSIGYMFSLSQQTEPPYEDCWMTDSVIPVSIPPDTTSIL
jgi:hypothetical protein